MMNRRARLANLVSLRGTFKSNVLKIVCFLIIIVLCQTLAVKVADIYSSYRAASIQNGLRLHGLSAMSESVLRKIVSANNLRVYWAGAQTRMEYLLDASDRSAIVLTILPIKRLANQTRATFPQITTYVQQDAFQAVLSGGGNPNVSGFINEDGNSVFFTKLDPDDVYVGLRGSNVEVQIFDPAPGQALALAREPGGLRPIK